MKNKIILPLVFAAAALATPARAHDVSALDFNDYNLPPLGAVYGPVDTPRDAARNEARVQKRFKEPECDLRERAKIDIGSGWSVGVGGSLGRPKIALNWRMSLQPELERRTMPKDCAFMHLRR